MFRCTNPSFINSFSNTSSVSSQSLNLSIPKFEFFSLLLVFLQLHQLLNGNQLSETTQTQKPRYFILIHKPCSLERLYPSTVLLLLTWGSQITSFPNQIQLSYDFICVLLLKGRILFGQQQSSQQVETPHLYNRSNKRQKVGLSRGPASNRITKSDRGSNSDKEVKVRPELDTYLILPAFYPSNPNTTED